MSTTIKCKICGDTEFNQIGDNILQCRSCRHKTEKPKDNAILMERANNIRFESKDFDEAAALYEEIIRMTPDDAEAYWGLVLCRFGIEYVKDSDGNYLPTCHRTVESSILDDGDYKMALAKADSDMLEYYISQAKTIEEYQAKIKQIAQKEKPYDVFISFKATENGVATPDSLLAQDIYYYLTKNLGLKVFFSNITLKDKAGQEFEPIIYAALNSATVMVVVGTNPEYISSVWVKNEWSRFCRMISENRGGKPKYIISALHGMRPEELPTTLASRQAIDLSELGSKEKLCSNIDSLIGDLRVSDEKKAQASITMEAMSGNLLDNEAHNLVGMGFQKLEVHDFAGATKAFEKALEKKYTLAEAYWGKFLASNQFESETALSALAQDFTKDSNYISACKYANDEELARYKKAVEECYRRLVLNNLGKERQQNLDRLSRDKKKFLENLAKKHDKELQDAKETPFERSRYYDKSIQSVGAPADTENLSESMAADFKEYADLTDQKNSTDSRIKDAEIKKQFIKKKFGNKFIDLLILVFSFLFIYAAALSEPAPVEAREDFLYANISPTQEEKSEIYPKWTVEEIKSISRNKLFKLPDFVLNLIADKPFMLLIISVAIVCLYTIFIMTSATAELGLSIGVGAGVCIPWAIIMAIITYSSILFNILMVISIVQFAVLLITALRFKTRAIIIGKKLSDEKHSFKSLEKNIEQIKTRLYSYKDEYVNAVHYDFDEMNRAYEDAVKTHTEEYDEIIAKCKSQYDESINAVQSATNIFEAAKLKVEKALRESSEGEDGFNAALDDEEKNDKFSVILISAGDSKIRVIKEICKITALGLKEAKYLIEKAPLTIKSNVSKAEAEEIKAAFTAQGAEVTVETND